MAAINTFLLASDIVFSCFFSLHLEWCFKWKGKIWEGPGPYQSDGPPQPRGTECGLQNCKEVEIDNCENTPIEPIKPASREFLLVHILFFYLLD